MKTNYLLTILSFACILISCDDGDDTIPFVDPRYAEMAEVSAITPTAQQLL